MAERAGSNTMISNLGLDTMATQGAKEVDSHAVLLRLIFVACRASAIELLIVYHAGVLSSTGYAAYVQRRAHKTAQLARRSRHAAKQTQRN